MSSTPRFGIIIAGPTAIGKSDLASLLLVSESFSNKLELVSCDSVQVYEGLDIGSNKDLSTSQHCINLCHWSQSNSFTAAHFYEICTKIIKEIVIERDNVPVLVGGTGFYLDWIVYGRPQAPLVDLETIQDEKRKVYEDGWDSSLKRLESVDSVYAQTLSKNDFYRLARALAVFRTTGKPLSSFSQRNPTLASCISEELLKKNAPESSSFKWFAYYITCKDRLALVNRIDQRCIKMLMNGLLEETYKLWIDGLRKDCPAGRSIGYAQCIDLFGEIANYHDSQSINVCLVQRFIEKLQAATRQYSRKQELWFRTEPFKWIYRNSKDLVSGDQTDLQNLVQNIIQDIQEDNHYKSDDHIDTWDKADRHHMNGQLKRYRANNEKVPWNILIDTLKKLFFNINHDKS